MRSTQCYARRSIEQNSPGSFGCSALLALTRNIARKSSSSWIGGTLSFTTNGSPTDRRTSKSYPVGIHNRSYYEEVLIARVHKEILASQQLPDELKAGGIWKRRFREICEFEQYLVDNGTVLVKIFLNVSKDEQRRRFLSRIDEEDKNWKFSVGDAKERTFWDDYMKAYEDMLEHTSTEQAPWYVVPANNKWFTRLAVSSILFQRIADLKLTFPKVTDAKKKELLEIRRILMAEDAKDR